MTGRRDRIERWLVELTALPTVPGREEHVVDWVRRWVGRRADLSVRTDPDGNLLVRRRSRSRRRPVVITAHLDHPGFVVTGRPDRHTIEWEFWGGVMRPYFDDAVVELVGASGVSGRARITDVWDAGPDRAGLARLTTRGSGPAVGDLGRWWLPERSLGLRSGRLHARACDDLAGVAAALAAMDRMRGRPDTSHVSLLLTRAEEIGFVGAVGAARAASIPRDARIVCLETSRSFPDSPLGGGPIVRVGDASTVFDPELTGRLAQLAARQGQSDERFRWQRKLMAGGSCEATAFGAFGYQASCLCLPLGNYHNMVDIDAVAAGTGPARLGPETIDVGDFHGLVDVLSNISRIDDVQEDALPDRLTAVYESVRPLLEGS